MDNHVQNLPLAPLMLTVIFLPSTSKVYSCLCTALCRLTEQKSVSIFHLFHMPYMPPPISSNRCICMCTKILNKMRLCTKLGSFLQYIQRGSVIHPVSYSMDTRLLSCR